MSLSIPSSPPPSYPCEPRKRDGRTVCCRSATSGLVAYGVLNGMYYSAGVAYVMLGPMGVVTPKTVGIKGAIAATVKQLAKVCVCAVSWTVHLSSAQANKIEAQFNEQSIHRDVSCRLVPSGLAAWSISGRFPSRDTKWRRRACFLRGFGGPLPGFPTFVTAIQRATSSFGLLAPRRLHILLFDNKARQEKERLPILRPSFSMKSTRCRRCCCGYVDVCDSFLFRMHAPLAWTVCLLLGLEGRRLESRVHGPSHPPHRRRFTTSQHVGLDLSVRHKRNVQLLHTSPDCHVPPIRLPAARVTLCDLRFSPPVSAFHYGNNTNNALTVRA